MYLGDCILPRGVRSLGPLQVFLSDPFGWFEVGKQLRESTRIKVYPAVQTVTHDDALGRAIARVEQLVTSQGPGNSDEFFTVREYRSGDPVRRIHWPLTAHRGFPVVREFTRGASGDLCVFVDRNRAGLVGVGRGSSLEHSVKIAAAMASHSLDRGHSVALVAGDAPELCAPPGSGRSYLVDILEVLIHVRPGESKPFPEVLQANAGGLAPGSTALVMIAPYLSDSKNLISVLASWVRRGVRVVAIIYDDASFRELREISSLAERSRGLEVALGRAGVRTAVMPCNADLQATVSEAVA